MVILEDNQFIEIFDSMYPCKVHSIVSESTAIDFSVPEYATAYGYVINGSALAYLNDADVRGINNGNYFCLSIKGLLIKIQPYSKVAIFIRYGFKGQNSIGGPIEQSGRLTYIDNCSDSLLIYPPRLGDPSMSHLHFPEMINQSFHIHPSIRLGVVVKGSGVSTVKTKGTTHEVPLTQGTVFYLLEREEHRFRTEDSTMDVIAFHPDGDWGPTDHNHSMLNRTYITKS
jgi:hypothetical protein